MATILKTRDRNVIPRWRDFRTTVSLGELENAAAKREHPTAVPNLIHQARDWEENRSLSFAGDLLSAAVLGSDKTLAKEAAEYVISSEILQPDHPLLTLAHAVLSSKTSGLPSEMPLRSSSSVADQIAGLRLRLNSSPRNAIGWVDLSLLFASRGLAQKARRAMLVGLGIAPNNRFVLRSAARLFLHLGELDLANNVLRKASIARFDPWVCASEIAIATATKRVSRMVDYGAEILRLGKFSHHDTSELSSAMGMLDFANGSVRHARKHVKKSLLAPNENSLAQARWIAKDMGGLGVTLSTDDFHVPRPFEASAWQAFFEQDWERAAQQSQLWAKDEAFSTRPVQLVAHIYASYIEDYEQAITFAKSGLVANPHENGFRITAAFAYGKSNQTEKALEQLKEVRGPLSAELEVARIANYGLIGFREADINRGRIFYGHAVEVSKEKEDRALVVTVLANWAREEILAGYTEVGSNLLERAKKADKAAFSIENPVLIAKVERLLLADDTVPVPDANTTSHPKKALVATSSPDDLTTVKLSWHTGQK